MKNKLTFYLLVSFSITFFFLWKKHDHNKRLREKEMLVFPEDVDYKYAFQEFKKMAKAKFPELNIDTKPSLILTFDSIIYDVSSKYAMGNLDSLAATFKGYEYNYFFVTEMDDVLIDSFLSRKGVSFKHFKVLGGAYDFVNALYASKPESWKMVDGKKVPSPPWVLKGYYLLDSLGIIRHNGYKYGHPVQDSTFLKKIHEFGLTKNELF